MSPIFFWAAALILPLAAVYFLKVKPRVDTITAFFLWKKIYHEKRSSSLFNRLRDLLSLLLMVLVFLLLTVAMTGPEFVSDDQQDLLIIIDNSASMAAGGASSRLDKAKSKAIDIISALTPGRRAAIASAAGRVEYHSYLSDNIRHLRRAIDSMTQTDLPFDVTALEKASASIGTYQDSRVVLISDGAAFKTDSAATDSADTNEKSMPSLPPDVELVKIESEAVNVGIVECDLQEIPTENSHMTLYYRLANSGRENIQADFLLYHIDDDNADATAGPLTRLEDIAVSDTSLRLIKAIPADIAPGVNEASFFYLADALPGRWLAVLDYEDTLPLDNIVYLNVRSPDPIHVSVLTQDRYFFEHCVLAFAESSSLLRLSNGPVAGQQTDVFLAEGTIQSVNNHSTAEKKAIVLFNPSGESDYWSAVGQPLAPESLVVRVLAEDDPALAYYDVTTIPFFGAKQIDIPADAQCLVETDSHVPLIWRLDRPEQDMVVVNMDPAQGDFYFSPYFPVMVYRLALGLVGTDIVKTASYKSGQSAPLETEDNHSIAVVDPLGTELAVSTAQSIGPLDTTGYYRVNSGEDVRYVPSSLLSENETLLNNPDAVTSAGPIRKGHSPSYWLIAAALAVVVAESILYHRRKVG